MLLLQKYGTFSKKALIYILSCWSLWICCFVRGEEVLVVRGAKFLLKLFFLLWFGVFGRSGIGVFDDKSRTVWAVIDSIVCEISLWVLVKKEFKSCSLNDMVCDWVVSASPTFNRNPVQRWIPPNIGQYKVNFDGACCANLGPGGIWVCYEGLPRQYYWG